MSGSETKSLAEDTLEELSAFLCGAFAEPEHQYLFQPEMLRWKYLDPAGDGPPSRSLLVREGGRVVAHLGLHCTAFGEVSAVHPYDWIARGTQSPHGLMLLLRTHRMTDIQYVLGCTDAAAQVYDRSGYRTVSVPPLFQKVLQPAAWRHLHRGQPLWKKAILLALDRFRSLRNPGCPPPHPVELRRVTAFGPELSEVFRQAPRMLCSRRDAPLLNHYLRFPPGTIRGWHVFDGSRLRGFALANVVQAGPMRLGKILECFLDTSDPGPWHAALFALVHELRALNCHLLAAYGSTPWTADGLRANGFFERGHTPLYWRDAKGKVALGPPFHVTYLEADTGLL